MPRPSIDQFRDTGPRDINAGGPTASGKPMVALARRSIAKSEHPLSQRLQDGGIEWFFYFRKDDVPRYELETIARAEHEKFLRLAVTFGSIEPKTSEYRSSTAVHLWQMNKLPPSVSWRKVLVHVFTHEPLHHVIGKCLAEMRERGDQEWVIRRLGDGRWW